MAAHETVTGIAKVASGVYEVTALTNLGAGFDNVSDVAFIQKDGGLLRFTTGHTAVVYTNCLFIETETAYRLGSNNKNNSSAHTDAPRFNGNSTCSPIFKGCRWIIYPNLGDPYGVASDFDIGSSDFTNTNGVAPRFIKSDTGAPCYIRNISIWNSVHLATANMVVDGLDVNSAAQIAGELIYKPVTEFKNLNFVNNHGSSLLRHLTIWNPNGARYKGLYARSLSIVGSGILFLIDPIGVVAKRDASWATGPVQALRTYKIAAINAVTKATLNAALVVTDAVNAVKYDADLTAGLFTGELLHYYQDHGSIAINYSNEYRRALVLFGYSPTVTPLTVENRPDGSPVDEGKVLLFPDAGVTSLTQAAVLAFTAITSAAQLYDACHVFQITRTDRHNVGAQLAVAAGSQIDFGLSDVVISGAAPAGYPLVVAGATITAFTNGGGFTVGGKFNKLIASNFTFVHASTVPVNCNLVGDVELGAVGDLSAVTINGVLRFTVAGTYNFNGVVVDGLINASGGEIIINADASTLIITPPDEVDDITILAPEIVFTVNLPAGITGIFAIHDLDSADADNLGTELQRNNAASGAQTFNYAAAKVGDYINLQFIAADFRRYLMPILLGASSTSFDIQLEAQSNR